MPSPVALPVRANNAVAPAPGPASSGQIDAALDFAALLFAQAESPAAPGLALVDPGFATAAAAVAEDTQLAASAPSAIDPASLQALLAAVVLPAEAPKDPRSDILPTDAKGGAKSPGRGTALPVPGLNPGANAILSPAASPSPGVADPNAVFGHPANAAAPPASAKPADTGPAIFSDRTGNGPLPLSTLSEMSAGAPVHPLAGHHAAPLAGDGVGNAAPVRVETPLGDARWHDDFGQKIVWLAKQDVQSAQISINPPNLGPIDVSLKLGPDQASAVFSSPHADVREALESALPRLREMLAGAGIQLGDTQVNAQSQQQAGYQPRQQPARDGAAAYPDNAILSQTPEINVGKLLRVHAGSGLVDTFA